jgi:outer membrane protein OmpA-like peptidoglycan-associated protein
MLAAFVLAACGTTTAPVAEQPLPRPAPSADQRAAVPARFAAERQWLSAWFKGTPVRIRQTDESTISVDVPREFCFEPGKASVKPALGAVLDKMAESLKRLSFADVTLIAAPGDGPGSSALALQRAAQVQERLRRSGVGADRLGKSSVASAPAVQLRMEAPAL